MPQLLEVAQGLVVAPRLEEELGEVVAGRGQVGHGVDRGSVGGHRLVEGGGVEGVVAALDVVALGRRQPLGPLEGARRELSGPGHVSQIGVHHRQLGVGHGEAGIRRHRLLQQGPGLVLFETFVVVHALDEVSVRVDRGGGDVLELLVGPLGHGLELQTAADASGQLVHQLEEALFGIALHPLRGQDLTARRVLQLGLDPELGSGADEAAHQGRRHVGPAGDLTHDLGGDGGGVSLPQIVEELVEPGGRQDAQGRRLGEVGDQHVGQPGLQPVELRVVGEVVEVEHGEGRAAVSRHRGRAALHRDEGSEHEDEDEGHDRRRRQEPPSAGTMAKRRLPLVVSRSSSPVS